MAARPIRSVRDLAWRLGIPIERLRQIAKRTRDHYGEFPIKKGSKVRIVRPPREELKRIQRRIKNNILTPIELPSAAHGGVNGKSPGSNAQPHLRKACVVNIDVQAFFDKVRHRVVYRMFRNELNYGRDAARLITRLTTLKGALPQGSPTSTAIANLVLAASVDARVLRSASGINATYTRFVDDISLSGPDPRPLINEVGKLLSRRGLKMHRAKGRKPKLKIAPSNKPQEVTGLNVNSGRLSVPKLYRDNVRAAIHALGAVDAKRLPRAINSVRGKIDHVRRHNPGTAQRMDRYLATTLAKRAP